jgi:hypothetical protein
MKRRSFLSGLLLGGGATAPVALAGSSYILNDNGKPRQFVNGQCPVCGAMAHAYPFDALQPERRLVRCSVCRGAFFQDQEEPGESAPETKPQVTPLELPRPSAL